MKTLFEIKDLPLSQFEDLGLYTDQQLLLGPDEIHALLNGRRTDLISLRELIGEGFTIQRLDARLSLQRADSGQLELMIHPIYKQARAHSMLSYTEMEDLIEGRKDFIGKRIEKEEGRWAMFNIEYDPITRDCVGYDVSNVEAPELINGMLLSEQEKSAFRRGETIELSDGTRVQHRGSEPKGLRSDRKELILLVLLDGGISYLLIRGIRSLSGEKDQKNHRTPAFNNALKEMEGMKSHAQHTMSPAHLSESAQRKVSRS